MSRFDALQFIEREGRCQAASTRKISVKTAVQGFSRRQALLRSNPCKRRAPSGPAKELIYPQDSNHQLVTGASISSCSASVRPARGSGLVIGPTHVNCRSAVIPGSQRHRGSSRKSTQLIAPAAFGAHGRKAAGVQARTTSFVPSRRNHVRRCLALFGACVARHKPWTRFMIRYGPKRPPGLSRWPVSASRESKTVDRYSRLDCLGQNQSKLQGGV